MASDNNLYKKANVYEECLTNHALQWMKSYQHMSSIWYVENNAGPILGYFIKEFGVRAVLHDLDKKIDELIR